MNAPSPRHLVDAGPLVAAYLPRDIHHAWSRAAMQGAGGVLYTTETILAEAAHFLKPAPRSLQALITTVHSGRIRLLSIFPTHLPRIAELIRDYPERADLADASLVVLSELHPRATLLTIDRRDFSVYRRADGKPVPCLFPD
ncbi:MAG: PIN domain-containing protein [Burkholderiales bacterium]|nr:PIN domain-containing protein [Opitutaceae bacterium]